MQTKKFWCHYLGTDGNTPKRRSIELTDISELLPNVSNEGAKTPLWYDVRNEHNYNVYAQLSDKVAIKATMLDKKQAELMRKTDADIDRMYEKKINEILSDTLCELTEEQIEGSKKGWKQYYDNCKQERDRELGKMTILQDYDNYLLSGVWITSTVICAYKEIGSPILSGLKELRKIGLECRAEEDRQHGEEYRKQQEEEARQKAEDEAKEQERLTNEEERFRNGETIAGKDVVKLCHRHGIKMHLRTVHNLQQVVTAINGTGRCHYQQLGKRKPVLDGCFDVAEKLYKNFQKTA